MDNCFKYYIENKKEVLSNLNLKLIQLKGQLYVCSDEQLPRLKREIINVKKTIKFNKQLKY